MFTSQRLATQLALAAAMALTAPLLAVAPQASAGDVEFSIQVGGYSDGYAGGHRESSYRPSGYYKSVWCSPVYRTRYDDCGQAYRVCVRAGYYKKVWVATSYRSSRYSRHSRYSNRRYTRSSRHQRYDNYRRRDRWSGCESY